MKKKTLTILCLVIATLCLSHYNYGNPPEKLVKYYFVEFLTNPEKPELPKAQIDSIQRAHLAHLDELYEEGKLLIAGPFEGGGGMVILNVQTKEAAEQIIKSDPAVSADRLNYRIEGWYTAKGMFTAEAKE